jgi:hypothetical protein
MFSNVPSLDFNFGLGGQAPTQPWQMPPVTNTNQEQVDGEEVDKLRRPANAFILYTQTMRSTVCQETLSLSNTECSRVLGKMWKEVSLDNMLQYKSKTAALQEEF